VTAVVTPEGILKDLHSLWASLGETHGVLRACAMTVIVLVDDTADRAATARERSVAETLGQVMQEHPHRAIIVRVRGGSEPALDCHVTAQCWRPFGRQRQICCEQVEMTAAERSLPDAEPVLLAITAPDLPVAVWCRSPRLFDLAALAKLYARADRIVVDSRDAPYPRAALARLARVATEGGGRLADLAWTSVTRWREIVAEIFEDPTRRESLPKLERVRVLHSPGAAPATAYYLAGWILAALNREDIEVGFEAVDPIGGGIEGIVLEDDTESISIRRAVGTAILIEIGSLKNCTSAPRLSEAELLGTELSITGRDPVFERTLPAAARLAEAIHGL
jgi:glucose-6-phosphate dehydrogenase assembly protein OpcA